MHITTQTTLCSIPLPSCLGNASGCHSSTEAQLNELPTSFVVSKSCTLTPRTGNQSPRLYIDSNTCINKMGLPNNGIDYYDKLQIKTTYILSIYANNINELEQLLSTSSPIIEVNISCPNINNVIDYESYLYKIYQCKGNKIIGVKLPPLFQPAQIITMCELLLKYEIDFITCCNTVSNCLVIKEDATVIYGNLGGMSFKAISLSNVYQYYKLLSGKIDIIGCGGIETGQDVYEYILCGATCVQIGTQLLREGVECFDRIEKELITIMKEKNYTSLLDFKGQVHDCKAKL